ncbi:MAG: hypothetical protein R3E97_04600 [Candidatus Eisenbacteria bacterium]
MFRYLRRLEPPWLGSAAKTFLANALTLSLIAIVAPPTTAHAEEHKKADPIGVEPAASEEVPGLVPGGPAVEEFRTDDGWSPVGGYRVLVDDVVDGSAVLYEDPEHHEFLVLTSGDAPAFVLEKTGHRVGTLPRSKVGRDQEGHPLPILTEVESYGSFVDDEGFARFDYDSSTYLLQPVPAVVGERTAAALLTERPEYAELSKSYEPNPSSLESLSRHHSDVDIVVLFPSWAKVSERIVPPLLRIVERADNPDLHLTFIGLDRGLAQPAAALESYAPRTVPAVIVKSNGREIARFEGTPERRLEVELVDALARHTEHDSPR